MSSTQNEDSNSSDEEKNNTKSTYGTPPLFGSEPVEKDENKQTPSSDVRHRTPYGRSADGASKIYDRSATPSKRSYQPTVESVNGARFTHFLLNLCQDVVRSLMQSFFGTDDAHLANIVKENNYQLSKNLFPYQMKILNKPSYKTLDFSLMYAILKTLRKSDIGYDGRLRKWDPLPECTTLYIALERIRLQRNDFAHLPDIDMKLEDFRYRWDIVRESVVFIADHLKQRNDIVKEVERLYDTPFDDEAVRRERQKIRDLKSRLNIVLDKQGYTIMKNTVVL